jgi:hypothetical protein
MLVDFLAVDDPRTDIGKLRSFDYTGAWINEAQEIQDRLIIEWIINRRGRYPDPQIAPITWSGVIADANAMSTTHWWYKWAEVVTPVGYKFWHQPPALLRVEKQCEGARQDGQGQWWIINPLCENIQGQALGARYWLDQVPGKDTAWIKLNLAGEYGASLFGKLVWPEFNPTRHIAPKPLEPLGSYPLQIGYDTGLTPAFVITQITEPGQYRVLDEICLTNMGMRQAVRDALKPMLSAKYPGWPVFAVGDPAGNRRADSDESTAADEIRAQGIEVKECPTNIFKPRRDAVAAFMLKRVRSMITGETSAEGFEVSPTCTMLLEALREGYVFGRILIQGREGYKEEPVKNEWSHVCVAKGTMILVKRGSVPIEDVTTDDMAWTPQGWRRVLAQARTARMVPVLQLVTDGGRMLMATASHKIFTRRGWKKLQDVTVSDYVDVAVPKDEEGVRELRRLTRLTDVYNLTVEEAHCYYANGILVKNCDALQYPATLYDRPRLGQQEMDRRFNSNGSPIELGFDPGFPMI